MQKQVNVDLNKCPDERCECGNPFYTMKTIIKRIPGIMVAQTEDIFNPVNYFACDVCGKPHRATKITVPQYETKGEA